MPKLGDYDTTPLKVFSIKTDKYKDNAIVSITYNDPNGVRHLSRFRLKPGSSTDKYLIYIRELATYSGSPRVLNMDTKYHKEHKRVSRKNHKMLAKDIIEKFAVIQFYLILSSIFHVAAESAENPRDLDRFSEISDKYKKLSEAGTKEFYDFMTPYTRGLIDGKIQEAKDAIYSRAPLGQETLDLVERQISQDSVGLFQFAGADYNSDPFRGDYPPDDVGKDRSRDWRATS